MEEEERTVNRCVSQCKVLQVTVTRVNTVESVLHKLLTQMVSYYDDIMICEWLCGTVC